MASDVAAAGEEKHPAPGNRGHRNATVLTRDSSVASVTSTPAGASSAAHEASRTPRPPIEIGIADSMRTAGAIAATSANEIGIDSERATTHVLPKTSSW